MNQLSNCRFWFSFKPLECPPDRFWRSSLSKVGRFWRRCHTGPRRRWKLASKIANSFCNLLLASLSTPLAFPVPESRETYFSPSISQRWICNHRSFEVPKFFFMSSLWYIRFLMKGIILRYYTRLFLRDFLLSLLTIYLHFMIMKSTQHFREPNSFWKIGVPSYTLCLIMWINYSRL